MELRVQDKVIPRLQCRPNQDAPGTKITKNRLKAGISQLNDFDTTSLNFSKHQPLAANRFQQKHTPERCSWEVRATFRCFSSSVRWQTWLLSVFPWQMVDVRCERTESCKWMALLYWSLFVETFSSFCEFMRLLRGRVTYTHTPSYLDTLYSLGSTWRSKGNGGK